MDRPRSANEVGVIPELLPSPSLPGADTTLRTCAKRSRPATSRRRDRELVREAGIGEHLAPLGRGQLLLQSRAKVQQLPLEAFSVLHAAREGCVDLGPRCLVATSDVEEVVSRLDELLDDSLLGELGTTTIAYPN